MNQNTVALSLFSGGLDSILASRVVAAQGIQVIAIKFISPFFDHGALADPQASIDRARELYGLDVRIEDITTPYLELLKKPVYGFGKNFNPCVDCKISMFKRAGEMMEEYGASFLISGEVLGQRPMSQRRDTLNVISRDSDKRDILLRPLSAKLMTPIAAERNGLVDREKLYDFSGRGRSRQIALAREFGITEFPAPAGGCRLADPILSKRIAALYSGDFVLSPDDVGSVDIHCLMVGRQFVLPGGGWLVIGRDQRDNEELMRHRQEDDVLLCMVDHPGPTALLRRTSVVYDDDAKLTADLELAGRLVVRYAKKVEGRHEPQDVQIYRGGGMEARRFDSIEEEFSQWIV
jgi:hypothetical protein